jgi:hypothetical protein
VPPGAEVRVSLNGVRFEGRVLGGARDTLVVAPALGGAPVRTALTPSDTVWVPIGRAWRRGALIGAGVGAAALSGLAIAYARAMCSPGASCGTGYGVLLGVTVGGTGGAALGAALGATVRRWQRVRP